MRRFCVIGDPVGHSKSPAIQNAMISVLGLDAEYLCKPVKLGEETEFLAQMRRGEWQGCNVTMPLKSAVIPHLDWVEEGALRCGAVNTIRNIDGKLYGYSTDGPGFLRSMRAAGQDPAGKTITLLGAGGAANSVAWFLAKAGARRVFCANRTVEKVEILCQLAPDILSPFDFSKETLCKLTSESELLINATSLGMEGLNRQFAGFAFVETLPEGAAVFDLIYHPLETELLRHARLRGLPTYNGTGMLLHQAVLSLEHFTGQAIDPALVLPAAQRALDAALRQ